MILSDTYTLPNGVAAPKLGLGTWMIEDDKAADAVIAAVKLGYRHIDTAQAYANERGVGEGIARCGVAREELFVQTKLAAEVKDYEGAKAAIQGSLDALGLEYIDLMIIHSPWPWANFGEEDRFAEGNLAAWKALEEFHKAGRIRAIGVSNFREQDLKNLIDNAEIKPMVDQVLCHIGATPFDLIAFCAAEGILVEAYSPVGHGAILGHPEIAAMAEKYGVSVPQLCIRYCLELGLLPLPKTGNPAHMAQNAEVDFEISAEDMAALKAIEPVTDYGEANMFPVYSGKN